MHFKLVKYLGMMLGDELTAPVETLQSAVPHWAGICKGAFFSLLKHVNFTNLKSPESKH